jgi:hypothetical protein
MSSRRFACDRCRTQKARCIRHEHQSRCSKCAHADTPCVTTKPASGFQILTCSAESFRADEKRNKRPRPNLPGRQPPENRSNRSPSLGMDYLFENGLNVSGNGSNSIIGQPPFDDYLQSYVPDDASAGLQDGHPESRETNAMGLCREDILYFGSEALTDAQWDVDIATDQWRESLNETAHITPSSNDFVHGTSQSWARSPVLSYGRPPTPSTVENVSPERICPNGEGVPTITGTEDSRPQGSETVRPGRSYLNCQQASLSLPTPDGLGSYVHMLAGLNLDLTTLLERMRNFDLPVTIYSFISPTIHDGLKDMTPLEDALEKTRKLLRIMNSLSESRRCARVPQPSICSTASPSQSASSNAYNISSPSTGPSLPVPPVIGRLTCPEDYNVVLQIILCYTNVVRLYIIIFGYIIRFMKTAPSSHDGRSIFLTGIRFDDLQISELPSLMIVSRLSLNRSLTFLR